MDSPILESIGQFAGAVKLQAGSTQKHSAENAGVKPLRSR